MMNFIFSVTPSLVFNMALVFLIMGNVGVALYEYKHGKGVFAKLKRK